MSSNDDTPPISDQVTRTDVDVEPPTIPDLMALPTDWDVPTVITHAPRPRRGAG